MLYKSTNRKALYCGFHSLKTFRELNTGNCTVGDCLTIFYMNLVGQLLAKTLESVCEFPLKQLWTWAHQPAVNCSIPKDIRSIAR